MHKTEAGDAAVRLQRLLSFVSRTGPATTALLCVGVFSASLAAGAAGLHFGAVPAAAQGFQWPWEVQEQAPRPREPVYRDPRAQPQPPPTVAPGPNGNAGAWAQQRSPVCQQLERRLVQENQRGGQARTKLPAIESEMRKLDQQIRRGEADLDRRGCYEYFLFSKTLRRTRSCLRGARQVEEANRRLAELEAERQSLSSAGSQSYQDEIIRELARNNCGPAYQQEARRRDRSPFSGFWDDGESDGYSGNRYQSLPFATYRTMCVRLCDGYYFPVSFSTLPNHFQRDQDVCQQKCAAPAELYYYQNPGGSIDQMVAVTSSQPYTDLSSAFRYRKEYVRGCSCKQAEFVPQTPSGEAPVDQGQLPDDPNRRAEMPQKFTPKR